MIIVKIGQGRGKVGKASRNLPWDLANQKKKSSRSFPLFLSFQFCFFKGNNRFIGTRNILHYYNYNPTYNPLSGSSNHLLQLELPLLHILSS